MSERIVTTTCLAVIAACCTSCGATNTSPREPGERNAEQATAGFPASTELTATVPERMRGTWEAVELMDDSVRLRPILFCLSLGESVESPRMTIGADDVVLEGGGERTEVKLHLRPGASGFEFQDTPTSDGSPGAKTMRGYWEGERLIVCEKDTSSTVAKGWSICRPSSYPMPTLATRCRAKGVPRGGRGTRPGWNTAAGS